MRVSTTQPAETWANGRRLPDPERASSEFEAFLVGEIWKQAQRGPRFSKLLGASSGDQATRAMWIDEVVRRAVEARGFGLAERLAPTQQASAAQLERGGGA